MPLILLALAMIALLLVLIVSIPLGIVFRYRAGTARRQARGWVATMNAFAAAMSATLFLVIAAVTSMWIPKAFTYSVAGLATGCLLGFIGLAATRWEASHSALHYTPSRLLILTITVVVAARIGYGFWRAGQAWQSAPDTASWIAQSRPAGSLAAGAVVLGYYLVYWIGVRRRLATRAQGVRRA